MKSLVSFAAVASVVTALVLVVNPSLFGECKHETPYSQPCPEPTTVTVCKLSNPCAGAKEQDVKTGDFGCQDNGSMKTQCLDAANVMGNMIECYYEYTCMVSGAFCNIDLTMKTIHYKLKKIQKPCARS
jgi:hypothetical protein